MKNISKIQAQEILDSRGNPTLRVSVHLSDGTIGTASVPSGASTGIHEALELRDGDKNRYGGKGVLKAAENVEKLIAPELMGMDPEDQKKIDTKMLDLDGTKNKSKLGANAILGVSMAVSKAAAKRAKKPLFEYLGGSTQVKLPVPMCNIVNGGLHSDNTLDFQEFMIVPSGAKNFRTGLQWVTETFHALKGILHTKKMGSGVGDEGGFAPNLAGNEEAMGIILLAMEKAGYCPGTDMKISLDSAASSFFDSKASVYDLNKSGSGKKTTQEMIELCEKWTAKYPLFSWEDPLAEEDWSGFAKLTAKLGNKILVVGDDLFVTNPDFIKKGIVEKSANTVLIKLNQIGSVTETLEAIRLSKEAGFRYIISHRSGETADTFIADLAVATGSGLIKTGSLSRSERVEKYNRLLEIERLLGERAQYSV